jgi:hypothetical protein
MLRALIKAGVVDTDEDNGFLGYDLRLESTIGPLFFTMHRSDIPSEDNPRGSRLYSLFGRIRDIEALPKDILPEANHYSGKWNFHMDRRMNPKIAVASIMRSIGRFLPPPEDRVQSA